MFPLVRNMPPLLGEIVSEKKFKFPLMEKIVSTEKLRKKSADKKEHFR